MRYEAVISFDIVGTHEWPEADGEEYYLAHTHRHVFHVTVRIAQKHENRDIEYVRTKQELMRDYPSPSDFGTASCESIAASILLSLHNRYPGRRCEVEVLEDGENGALVGDD